MHSDKTGGAFWESFAPRYDRFMRRLGRGYQQLTERICAAVRAESRVVELATGTGLIALAIAPRVKSVVAIDLSPAMISEARDKAAAAAVANADFRVADATDTGLPAHSADVVIACNVLHVMPDPERLVREILRIVKPDGMALVASYCHGQSVFTRAVSALMSVRGFVAYHKWSVEGLRAFLRANGLRVESEAVIRGVIPMLYAQARGRNTGDDSR